MTEIVPGIHRFKIPLPGILLDFINVYLIRGNNGHLLIDTGLENTECLESLKSQVSGAGLRLNDISQIAATHGHFDHYALGGKLREHSGAHLMVHQKEYALFNNRPHSVPDLQDMELRWLLRNGAPEKMAETMAGNTFNFLQFLKFPAPDVLFQGGETVSTGLYNFKVIWTPGHAPGHVCFYEPDKKILISGDHVLPSITPNIGIHPYSSPNALLDFINSLEKIENLEVEIILPAHENPFTDLKKRVKELIKHHQQRSNEALSVMGKVPGAAYQIATKMTWLTDIGGMAFEKLSPLDKRLAVLETIAHLEMMVSEGKLSKSTRDGVNCYQHS